MPLVRMSLVGDAGGADRGHHLLHLLGVGAHGRVGVRRLGDDAGADAGDIGRAASRRRTRRPSRVASDGTAMDGADWAAAVMGDPKARRVARSSGRSAWRDMAFSGEVGEGCSERGERAVSRDGVVCGRARGPRSATGYPSTDAVSRLAIAPPPPVARPGSASNSTCSTWTWRKCADPARRPGLRAPGRARKAGAGLLAVVAVPKALVLGADTEVVLDGEVFGKPRDAGRRRGDAAPAVRAPASGAVGGGLVDATREAQAMVATEVEFAELSDAEIERYVATGEPMGKAGAYAIQGRAEAFVRHLSGSYSGVVGLPLQATAALLRGFGAAP